LLTRIDVRSENAFWVPTIGATPKDNLLIRKIAGLDPPDINLFIGDYSRDGGLYQGRRVGNRNVVITFDLNPNPAVGETVSGLREMLYKAFIDPSVEADYVKLELTDDEGRVRYVVGYTEKFETEIFDIETMAQISIICPDPYIRDNVEKVVSDPIGLSAFPFPYDGTAETGFFVKIYIFSPTSQLHLTNNPVSELEDDINHFYKGRMLIYYDFLVGDIITINTVRGQREITLTRGATDTSIVAGLAARSPWLELHSQSNSMKVRGSSPGDNAAGVRELRYTQAYWGI
jgi:hypothetical protein